MSERSPEVRRTKGGHVLTAPLDEDQWALYLQAVALYAEVNGVSAVEATRAIDQHLGAELWRALIDRSAPLS